MLYLFIVIVVLGFYFPPTTKVIQGWDLDLVSSERHGLFFSYVRVRSSHEAAKHLSWAGLPF